MKQESGKKKFVFRSFVNSFHYLYGDAEYFHQLAREMEGRFEQYRLCRTAVLLYVLSLEGLINRAMDQFLPERLRDFFLDREEKFSLEDKWLLLPLLVSDGENVQSDRSRYPWSHFAELVRLRNDFVHPKHDRPAYYRAITALQWEPLPWRDMPKDLGVKETEVVYRQTHIPKDPYAVRPRHVDIAKKVVDDTVAELDRLLGGKLTKDNWHRVDQMTLIYPPGATLNDLPPSPRPQTLGEGKKAP